MVFFDENCGYLPHITPRGFTYKMSNVVYIYFLITKILHLTPHILECELRSLQENLNKKQFYSLDLL